MHVASDLRGLLPTPSHAESLPQEPVTWSTPSMECASQLLSVFMGRSRRRRVSAAATCSRGAHGSTPIIYGALRDDLPPGSVPVELIARFRIGVRKERIGNDRARFLVASDAKEAAPSARCPSASDYGHLDGTVRNPGRGEQRVEAGPHGGARYVDPTPARQRCAATRRPEFMAVRASTHMPLDAVQPSSS
jgi:hypothetical protein